MPTITEDFDEPGLTLTDAFGPSDYTSRACDHIYLSETPDSSKS